MSVAYSLLALPAMIFVIDSVERRWREALVQRMRTQRRICLRLHWLLAPGKVALFLASTLGLALLLTLLPARLGGGPFTVGEAVLFCYTCSWGYGECVLAPPARAAPRTPSACSPCIGGTVAALSTGMAECQYAGRCLDAWSS